MSTHAAHIRSVQRTQEALAAARRLWAQVQRDGVRLERAPDDLPEALQTEQLVLIHLCFLEALAALIERGGGSRGAYVLLDEAGDRRMVTRRGRSLPHRGESVSLRGEVLEVRVGTSGRIEVTPVPVRPLPVDDSWYETTWREWREGRVFQV